MTDAGFDSETAIPAVQGSGALASSIDVAWSAATINFNGGDAVSDTITSLKALQDPPDEILLVDDGSTDGSLAAVRVCHPDARIVPMPQHTGRPAAVRNQALRNAHYQYMLLCDNDIQLAPDAVAHLLATMRSAPNVAVCSTVVVADDAPDLIQALARPLHFLCWSTALQERTLAEAQANGPRPGLGCGIQLLDVEMATAAGLFDENLALGWMDDGDLHHRLNLLGYRCLSVPEAVVFHQRERNVSRTYGQIHNRWRMLLSCYQLRTLIVIAPALAVFELLLMAHMLVAGEIRSYASALRDVIAGLSEIRALRRKIQRDRRVADTHLLSALDLDLPRHLRGRSGLISALRCLSTGFRWYWLIGRRLL